MILNNKKGELTQMNPKYFKDKIFAELNASYEYIKLSIDALKIDSKWSESFKIMSDDRYKHAMELYKMFMQLYTKSKEHDAYMNSIRDAIIETFASQTQKIDGYKATYDLIVEDNGEVSNGQNSTE